MKLLDKFREKSYGKIVENTVMLVVLQFSNIALQLVTSGYQSRVFGDEGFNIIGAATIYMSFFQLFIDFGFVISATGKISQNRHDKAYVDKVMTCVVIAKLMFISISFIAMPLIFKRSFTSWQEEATYWLYLASTALLALLPDYVYRGFERMSAITIRSVSIKVFATVLIFIFVKQENDYYLIPLFNAIGNLGALFVVYTHLNKKLNVHFCRVKFRDVLNEIKESAQFFASRIATTVYSQVNGVILDQINPMDVGYYKSATMVVDAARNGLVSPIAESIYPSMMRNGDFSIIKKALKITLPIMIAGCTLVYFISDFMCTIWLGAERGPEVAKALRALLPVVVISVPSYILGFSTLSPMGLAKQANASVTFGTVVHLINLAILYFTGNMNIINFCILTSIAEGAILLYRAVVVYRNRDLIKEMGMKSAYEYARMEHVEKRREMPDEPKVTVIVPVYNVEEYLERCVASILNQSMGEFELILVDDGSTDSSGRICDSLAEMDGRIRVIHQENKGLGGARNTGIEEANGAYLMFVDSDDTLLPHALEQLLNRAEQSGAEMVIFRLESVNEQGMGMHVFTDDLPEEQIFSLETEKKLLLASPGACNKLIATRLFRESGIRFPEKLWYEDLHTIPKLYLHTDKIYMLPKVLYLYLQRDGSIMNSRSLTRNREIIAAVDSVTSYYKELKAYEEYKEELDFLSTNNVLRLASVRVIKGGAAENSQVLSELLEYQQEHQPGYTENRHYKKLDRKSRLACWLIYRKKYGVLEKIFKK